MTIEGQGLVLRGNEDSAQPGVDAVAQSEVNDSVRPAEVNSRLGALFRQRVEALAGSASEKDNQDIVEVHAVTTGWR